MRVRTGGLTALIVVAWLVGVLQLAAFVLGPILGYGWRDRLLGGDGTVQLADAPPVELPPVQVPPVELPPVELPGLPPTELPRLPG